MNNLTKLQNNLHEKYGVLGFWGIVWDLGNSAKVRIARKMEEDEYRYAVKYMKVGKPYSKDTLIQVLREENALGTLKHKNLLSLYETHEDGMYEKIGWRNLERNPSRWKRELL